MKLSRRSHPWLVDSVGAVLGVTLAVIAVLGITDSRVFPRMDADERVLYAATVMLGLLGALLWLLSVFPPASDSQLMSTRLARELRRARTFGMASIAGAAWSLLGLVLVRTIEGDF